SGQWTDDDMKLEALTLATSQTTSLAKNAQSPTSSAGGALAWITLARLGQPGYTLNVLLAGTSNVKTVVNDSMFVQINRPRLSPDGKQIAFSASGALKADGSLASPGAVPSLSLVPSAQAHGLPWDPWVVNVDGTGLKRLAAVGSDEQALAWSSDGQRLAM